jgi:hypothetical protein
MALRLHPALLSPSLRPMYIATQQSRRLCLIVAA